MGDSKRVVLLNGPAGVGKTTVGRRLAATARNGICIHGDDIKNFVVNREPGAVLNGLTYAAGALLADLYLDAGYDLVVFEFVFNDRSGVVRFQDQLSANVPVHVLTLWAPLRTVQEREAVRPDREPLGQRVTGAGTSSTPTWTSSEPSSTRRSHLEAVISAVEAELTQAG